MWTTTNIFGYNFICNASYDELANEIIATVNSDTQTITNFITPNAHGINMYLKHPELNEFCKASKYVLPDGQPIVWLSRFTNSTIKQRLTGSDFFPVIFKKLKSAEHRCMFVVSNQLIKDKFLVEKPDASYIIPDYFNISDTKIIDEIGEMMTQEIISQRINYVFIGISEPKQGALAKNVTEKLEKLNYKGSCLFFFLGASYEFYFGLKKRAPKIFQKYGLEWFYRLLTEPSRMYKRYIFGNLVFIIRAFKWFFKK